MHEARRALRATSLQKREDAMTAAALSKAKMSAKLKKIADKVVRRIRNKFSKRDRPAALRLVGAAVEHSTQTAIKAN
jgi:hypothetical protein